MCYILIYYLLKVVVGESWSSFLLVGSEIHTESVLYINFKTNESHLNLYNVLIRAGSVQRLHLIGLMDAHFGKNFVRMYLEVHG